MDQNIAPEATVARVAKQFEEKWQGQQGYAKALTQGDQSEVMDALLDQSFHEIWPEVNSGSYSPDFSVGREGLLEDLEHRVALQNARLRQWQDYQSKMQQNLRSPSKVASPVRRIDAISPPKGKAAEKNLVFSPRKSPRKSEFPMPIVAESTPTVKSSPSFQHVKQGTQELVQSCNGSLQKADGFLKRRVSHAVVSPEESQLLDSDYSGFSEISNQGLTQRLELHHSLRKDENAEPQTQARISSSPLDAMAGQQVDSDGFVMPRDITSNGLSTPRNGIATLPPSTDSPIDQGVSVPESPLATKLDENSQAERILSSTINASPSPAQPSLSLVERTRQSLAFASPGAHLTNSISRPKHHNNPQAPAPRLSVVHNARALEIEAPRINLAERTRQSISLAQSKPKPPRKSTFQNRRDSRIYPVNQFETPHKPGWGKELTPPEELFSPKAGYDSVFKSRPKVGFSPTGTPTQELEVEAGEGGTDGDGRLETSLGSSPLARMAGKV